LFVGESKLMDRKGGGAVLPPGSDCSAAEGYEAVGGGRKQQLAVMKNKFFQKQTIMKLLEIMHFPPSLETRKKEGHSRRIRLLKNRTAARFSRHVHAKRKRKGDEGPSKPGFFGERKRWLENPKQYDAPERQTV